MTPFKLAKLASVVYNTDPYLGTFEPWSSEYDFCRLVEFCQVNDALGLSVIENDKVIWYSRVHGKSDFRPTSFKDAWINAAELLIENTTEFRYIYA